MPFSSEEDKMRLEYGFPGSGRGSSNIPYVPGHGVPSGNHLLMRSSEPPLSPSGCARATPILNQRFGPNFNRRFTQPNGAPYPLRPHSDTRNVHRVYPVSMLGYQNGQPTAPVYYRQTRTPPPNYIKPPSSLKKKAPPVPVPVPVPLPAPAPTLVPVFVPIRVAAPEPPVEPQLNMPLPRPPREPLVPQSCPAAWQDVHIRREERITSQLAAKSIELDEFKKKFPDGTSVKEILTSGWYKDHLTGKLVLGTDPACKQEQSGKTSTFAADKPATDTELNRAVQLVNSKSHWRGSYRSRQSKYNNSVQPSLTPQYYMQNGLSGLVQRNAQQQYLLPVKIQQVVPTPLASMENDPSSNLGALQSRQQFTREYLVQAQNMQNQAQLPNNQPQEMAVPAVSVDQHNLSSQRSNQLVAEDSATQEAANQLSMLSMAEHNMTRLTPTGNRSSNPNNLRKNRSTDGCSSPMGLVDHILFGSSVTPTVSSPSRTNQGSNLTNIPEVPSEFNALDTPRRRARKQILVSDHHYRSSHLYSLLQDELQADEILNESADVEPLIKEETPSVAETTIKKEFSTTEEKSKDMKINNFTEQNLKMGVSSVQCGPPVKKSRGRPRKDRTQEPPQKGVNGTTRKPRKPKKVEVNPEDREKAEEERKALLQALPSNLLDAIEAQKVMDKEHERHPRKYTRKPKAPKESSIEEQSLNAVSASLQFLQSIATIDPNILFAGLNSSILNESDSNDEPNNEIVNFPFEDFSASQQVSIVKEISLPPPTATAVATSGTPLILAYENPPRIITAPIWTDETGPLVPIAMYQKNKKIEKKPMLEQFPELKIDINEKASGSVQPPIITKGALKLLPEFTLNQPVDPIPSKHVSLKLESLPTLLPPWQPPKQSVPRKIPPMFRRLQKSPPPVKNAADNSLTTTIKRIKEKPLRKVIKKRKYKISKKKRDCQMIRLMEKYRKSLERFEAALFNGVSIEDTKKRVNNRASRKEEQKIVEKVNSKFDVLVKNCVTSKFDEQSEYVISYQEDSNVTRFALDWESRDSGSRWLSWHEMMVNSCVKDIKSWMVEKKTEELNNLVGIVNQLIERVEDPVMQEKIVYLATEIRKIHDRLNPRVTYFMNFGQISMSRTFEIKLKAMEQRLAGWMKIKAKHRENEVEKAISNWKTNTNNYIGSVISEDREKNKQLMLISYENLITAIILHDALVDVIMFASRLQVLYYHAHRLYSNSIDISELQDVIKSVEDTEYFLILAETKVHLIEKSGHCERTNIIDIFMEADSMNVEKGKLRRLVLSRAEINLIKSCEEKLNEKVSRFCNKWKDCELSEITSAFPLENWTDAIQKEETDRKNNQKPDRINIYVESEDFDFDYSLEIPPKLLATSTLERTLSQMLVTIPQTTNIVDEKFWNSAYQEKKEPKLRIRSIIPLYRMVYENYQKRCQILNANGKHCDIRQVENTDEFNLKTEEDKELLKKIRDDVAILGSVVCDDQLVEYNPATNDEEQLDETIQQEVKKFRKRKREQAMKRRTIIEKSLHITEKGQAGIKKKKMRAEHGEQYLNQENIELGTIDYKNIASGIKMMVNEIDVQKPEEESDSSSVSDSVSNFESDCDFDVDSIVDSIRDLKETLHTTENENTKMKCQRLLELQKINYEELQKHKRFKRNHKRFRVRGNGPEGLIAKDSEFDFILDQLEFKHEISDDDAEKNNEDDNDYARRHYVNKF